MVDWAQNTNQLTKNLLHSSWLYYLFSLCRLYFSWRSTLAEPAGDYSRLQELRAFVLYKTLWFLVWLTLGWGYSALLTVHLVALEERKTDNFLWLLTHSIPQNDGLVPCSYAHAAPGMRASFCELCCHCLKKQNEHPSDEGGELYHFLLHCFDVQIGGNTMAIQRNISFLKH